MIHRFDKVIEEPGLRQLLSASNLNLLQVVTLASIVEKEAKKDEEAAGHRRGLPEPPEKKNAT